jgi:hypothetical protein
LLDDTGMRSSKTGCADCLAAPHFQRTSKHEGAKTRRPQGDLLEFTHDDEMLMRDLDLHDKLDAMIAVTSSSFSWSRG